MNLDGTSFTDRIHTLVGLPLDIDLFRIAIEHFSQIGRHRVRMRRDLGLLADDGGIHVSDTHPMALHPTNRFLEKSSRVGPLILRSRIREKAAYIRLAQCTQNGIRDGMQKRVPVRMTHGALFVFQFHPTEYENPAVPGGRAGFKPM